MNIFELLQKILDDSYNENAFSLTNIPDELSKLDVELTKVLNAYQREADNSEEILENISIDMAWLLLGFSVRMATYSLRHASQEYFTNGILALKMSLPVIDEREILIILVLYNDVYNKDELIIPSIITQQGAFNDMLVDFFNRVDEDKTIECMGYILCQNDNGALEYRRTW